MLAESFDGLCIVGADQHHQETIGFGIGVKTEIGPLPGELGVGALTTMTTVNNSGQVTQERYVVQASAGLTLGPVAATRTATGGGFKAGDGNLQTCLYSENLSGEVIQSRENRAGKSEANFGRRLCKFCKLCWVFYVRRTA